MIIELTSSSTLALNNHSFYILSDQDKYFIFSSVGVADMYFNDVSCLF